MALVFSLDILALAGLVCIAHRHGLERALPLAAFFLILFPEESKIPLGLFDITSQRLVTLTLAGLAAFTSQPSGLKLRHMPLKTTILALIVWWALAAAHSIAFTDSLKALLALMLDYVAIFYIFAKFVTTTKTVRSILFGITTGLIVCSLFGVFEAYGNWSVVSLFPTEIHRFAASGSLYIDDARGLRAQSTFGHPILFGSALAMGIPMALYLISTSVTHGRRLFLWSGLLLMFASIFKTSSRGPWMALGFSLILFLLLGGTKMKRYIVTITLLALTVLLVRPGVRETIWNDYVSTVDSHSSQGESYQYRYVLYSLVTERLNLSTDRAILGYGPQSFPYLHLSGTINGRWMSFVSCDSSFAALLVETGYIGLLLACYLLAIVLARGALTYWRLKGAEGQVCLLFVANLCAFYFEMTNVAIFGWGQQTILLWVIMAMTMIYPALLEAERNDAPAITAQVTSDTDCSELLHA